MKNLIKSLLNFFVQVDNFCYRVINKLVVLENNGIHPKHRILNYHKFFTDNILATDNVLDVGCGNGNVAFSIAQKANSVVAVDIKEQNITYAKKHFLKENLEFLVGDVLNFNFGRKFEILVLSNVLEHIEDRVAFLKRLHLVSDKILLRVPLLDRDWLTVYKKERNMEYRLDPTHFTEYTLTSLGDELVCAGWCIDTHSIQFGEFWGILKKKQL